MTEIVISQRSAEYGENRGGRNPSLLFVHCAKVRFRFGNRMQIYDKMQLSSQKFTFCGTKKIYKCRKKPAKVCPEWRKNVPGMRFPGFAAPRKRPAGVSGERLRPPAGRTTRPAGQPVVEYLPGGCGTFPRFFCVSLSRRSVRGLEMTVLRLRRPDWSAVCPFCDDKPACGRARTAAKTDKKVR